MKQVLKRHGCRFVRQGKGDHEVWYSPITGAHLVVDSAIKSRHTANAALKQAGIEKAF
ncbi:MAG: type II toxin-antitoxin system HicA family toxin [Methylococcaceae bacterium]|nr:MAG: type II toxin-antitoxin system HicA family toxin [Methylococcaceae bacterium]